MPVSPYPLKAQVLSQDPENDGVYVMLQSGQVLNFLVRRTYPHSDGVRISKPPLPSRGSHILIVYPGGDIRNPMMLGAYHPNQVDPLPSAAADPFADYESDYSGGYYYKDGVSGNVVQQWADNSYFVMGSSLSIPTIYRHQVTSAQVQERIPFTQSFRNPNPQKPFAMGFGQATSGSIGGTTFQLDASGNLLVSGTVQRSITLKFGGATLVLDASGTITATPGASTNFVVSGNLHVTQAIIAGFGGADQVGVQTHTHAQPVDSHGDTEQETIKPTAGS
jgi:hypothetical protein